MTEMVIGEPSKNGHRYVGLSGRIFGVLELGTDDQGNARFSVKENDFYVGEFFTPKDQDKTEFIRKNIESLVEHGASFSIALQVESVRTENPKPETVTFRIKLKDYREVDVVVDASIEDGEQTCATILVGENIFSRMALETFVIEDHAEEWNGYVQNLIHDHFYVDTH